MANSFLTFYFSLFSGLKNVFKELFIQKYHHFLLYKILSALICDIFSSFGVDFKGFVSILQSCKFSQKTTSVIFIAHFLLILMKIFDHIYENLYSSNSSDFQEIVKKIIKIENKKIYNLTFMHVLTKILNNRANKHLLQWDFFFGTEEVLISHLKQSVN